MSKLRWGFLISSLVHAALVSLLLSGAARLNSGGTKLLVVDLSLTSLSAPAPTGREAEASNPPVSHPAPPPSLAPSAESVEVPPAEASETPVAHLPTPPVAFPVDEAAAGPGLADDTSNRPLESEFPEVNDGEAGTVLTGAGEALREESPVSAVERYIKAHFLYIQEDIQQNITYPRIARRMGWEGKVVVSFTIREDGTVHDLIVVESSGFALLDQHVLDTIEKTAPFPNPPVRAQLVVPIVYRLG